jgi:uncharacterized protein
MRIPIHLIVRVLILLAIAALPAAAETPSDLSPQHEGDATAVAKRVLQRARRGDARAQAELGLMYAIGREVPQNYENAVEWYRRAADQGEPTAQYFLGLMYDKGQGVPQDAVVAQKWLILATAKATGQKRDYYARVRDAIAFKLSPEQIDKAQRLAAEWTPAREK